MTKTPETTAEIRQELEAGIAELEACTLDDEIMAWPYGLAVGFTAEGKPYAASLDKAVTAADVLYPVRNGNNVAAVRMGRQQAIREHVAQLRSIIAKHLEAGA